MSWVVAAAVIREACACATQCGRVPASPHDWPCPPALQAARQQQSLAAVAQQLRAGADALRGVASTEDRFYEQVARLQRCWKVRARLNCWPQPMTGAPAACTPPRTVRRRAAPDGPACPRLQLRVNPAGATSQFSFDIQLLPATSKHVLSLPDTSVEVPWHSIGVLRGPLGDVRVQVDRPQGGRPAEAVSASLKQPSVHSGWEHCSRTGCTGGCSAVLWLGAWCELLLVMGGVPWGPCWPAAITPHSPATLLSCHAGVQAVHRLLLHQQQMLMWAAARSLVEAEEAGDGRSNASSAAPQVHSSASAGSGWHGSFLYVLARLLLRKVAGLEGLDGSGEAFGGETCSPTRSNPWRSCRWGLREAAWCCVLCSRRQRLTRACCCVPRA
jgi:hypothetical protein